MSKARLAVFLAVLAGALSVPASAFGAAAFPAANSQVVSTGPPITLAHAFLGQAYTGPTFTATEGSGGATCQPGGTWTATGLPTGVTINSTTGAISGTPTASAGVRNWSFTVTWTKFDNTAPNCGNGTSSAITLPVVHKFSGGALPASGNLSGITRSSTDIFLAASNSNQVITIAGANTINPTTLTPTDFSSNFPASSLNWPNGLAVVGSSVFVTNFFATGSPSGAKNVAKTSPAATTDLPLCSNAAGVGAAQNGTDIFVTCPGSNRIYQLNTSGAVVGNPLTLTPCTATCRPAAILAIPRTDVHLREVLVGDAGNDKVFWIRATATGPEIGGYNGTTAVAVTGNPVAVDSGCVPANATTDTPNTSNNHTAYVACPGLGRVDRIDLNTSATSPTLGTNTSFLVGNSVNSRPFDVKLDDSLSTPQLIVANSGTSASSVSADRDVRAMTITGTNQVPVQLGSSSIPDGIALFKGLGAPARSVAYITDEGTGSVWVVDPPGVKKAKKRHVRARKHHAHAKKHHVRSKAASTQRSARARNIAELRAHAAIDPLNPPR